MKSFQSQQRSHGFFLVSEIITLKRGILTAEKTVKTAAIIVKYPDLGITGIFVRYKKPKVV